RPAAALGVELEARDRAALDRGDDRGAVLDLGDGDRLVRGTTEGVREVDVLAIEAQEQLGLAVQAQAVPTHVRDVRAAEPANRAAQHAETAAPLLAVLEEKLHPEADSEHGAAGFDALTEGVGQAA